MADVGQMLDFIKVDIFYCAPVLVSSRKVWFRHGLVLVTRVRLWWRCKRVLLEVTRCSRLVLVTSRRVWKIICMVTMLIEVVVVVELYGRLSINQTLIKINDFTSSSGVP